MKKLSFYLILIFLAFTGPTAVVYYRYVTNDITPYDDIGIRMNTAMPGVIQNWGCGRLKANFADLLPPEGCAVEGDPTIWRD